MVLKPAAVAVDVDHLAVVQQPVEDGGGDHCIPEEFLPVGTALIRSDNGGAAVVAMGDELEEQVCLPGVDGPGPRLSPPPAMPGKGQKNVAEMRR
jgi:hypothetical protein